LRLPANAATSLLALFVAALRGILLHYFPLLLLGGNLLHLRSHAVPENLHLQLEACLCCFFIGIIIRFAEEGAFTSPIFRLTFGG
jgi:hypothetical protein